MATKLLWDQPPCSYSAIASELHRRLGFKTTRASVRRWAIANQLTPDPRYKTPPKPVKRWQARDYGALWQYDTTPHAWLPGCKDKQGLLDLLDNATRLNTGARLYPAETLLAHFDFLSRVFQAHGLPLALYVDYHSFFYTHHPEAFTQLGQALHFYGVKLLYAPTPQAKGKIERRHDYWQKRLVPLRAAERIVELGGPIICSINSSRTPTNTKSTANWARRPTPPSNKPRPNHALSSVPPRCVRDGPTSGARANPRPRRRRRQSPRRHPTPHH